jgi:S-disulfanyl-L-cysteine oxidoreductase SoxD
MRRNLLCAIALSVLAAVGLRAQDKPAALGHPASAEAVKQRDITVLPNGKGLPEGQGTATDGEAVYKSQCASCHGPNGEGQPQGTQLVGGIGTLASANPIRTVGSYWPYATSVWDYIHRAMPLNQPGSLSANDTYAVTAFLLQRNGIIQASDVMNQDTLAKVRMPNRDGFVADARPDVATASRSPQAQGSRKQGAPNSKSDSK